MSSFAKLIHDKQLLVLAITGLFAVADGVFSLHFSTAELGAGAGVVASYILGSSYLAAKHAQGEHQVAAAAHEAKGSRDVVENVMHSLGAMLGDKATSKVIGTEPVKPAADPAKPEA